MRIVNSRIPVIVGIGEITDRPADLTSGLEPLALLEQALKRAEHDSGTSLLQADTYLLEGTYNAPAGTILQFGCGIPTAPLQGQPSLVLNGPGQFQFISGDLLFPLTVISNLVLTGGTLHLGAAFEGGSITNLALDGITLTNTLPVTGGLAMTNSSVTGASTVANGGAWSAYGAKRAQPVATGGKWESPENGSNKPIGSGWQPTATVSQW